MRKPLDRVLGGVVGGAFALLGIAELALRLDDPSPLLFWLPTLWGGAGLVLVGTFRTGQTEKMSKALIILGALLGFLPSAWTVVMPVLIITIVIRTLVSSGRQERLQ